MSKFLDMMDRGVLVGDGALGTLLLQDLGSGSCPESANLSAPDRVVDVHLRYIQAGAHIIETNTFAANRVKLKQFGLSDRVEEINSQAVKLAREAREISGKDVLLAGSLGPLDAFDLLAAEEKIDSQAEYRLQAEVLEQRGVEAFMIETFSSSRELRIAVQAVQAVSSLPIIAQMTFPGGDLGGLDLSGLGEVFEEVGDLSLAALGINCGAGPREMLEILERVPRRKFPLSAYPNAGVPVRSQGRYIYPDSSPHYFASFAREAARLGARVVGGCCGTHPGQIAAMVEALRDVSPIRPSQVWLGTVEPEIVPPKPEPASSQLATKLAGGHFAVSVQIDPPKGTETGRLMEAVAAFKQSGLVDVVDVNSNPLGRLHMDSLWMSLQVEKMGLESLPHITPRDASIMGLQGNLLGAHALGIRNLLVITGDPSIVGGAAGGKDVYQTDSVGLVRLIAELNEGRDALGHLIGSPTQFFVGVAVNPAAEDLGIEVRRFRQKIENGARFAMTQVFFDWAPWDRFLDVLGEEPPIPILLAIWPLTSFRLALRLHHEVPGILLPDELLGRLERAGKGARELGFEHARLMLEKARERVAGVYIIAPFKDPLAVLELMA